MPIMEELTARLAAGEVLEGEDAAKIWGITFGPAIPWRFCVLVALNLLHLGDTEGAIATLETLLETEEPPDILDMDLNDLNDG